VCSSDLWTERFLAFIISISPILMMVGLTAVYMEMKMPGFGTPGIVGIICLSLAFGSQYTVGLANYMEFLIILLGLVLLGLEMFVIPGFGIAGISGFVFITIGLILSLQDFVIPKPSMPWQKGLMIHNVTMVVGSYVIAVVGGLMLIRYLIPRLSVGRSGPYLSSTLKDARASTPETLAVRIGNEGVAMSYLRPSGKMRIGTEYYDVISQGEFIEQGTPVTVTGIQGNRIIVSRKDAA
jgi:membrane-bound serine protease (ClpP class)